MREESIAERFVHTDLDSRGYSDCIKSGVWSRDPESGRDKFHRTFGPVWVSEIRYGMINYVINNTVILALDNNVK